MTVRIPTMVFAGSLLLVLSALSPDGAVAQNVNANAAVQTSRLGTMTCREFQAMDRRGQDGVVRRMTQTAPRQSLATRPNQMFNQRSGRITNAPSNRATVPGTPLTAGQLIAACQAASPHSTLRTAFSRFNSGGANTLRNRR